MDINGKGNEILQFLPCQYVYTAGNLSLLIYGFLFIRKKKSYVHDKMDFFFSQFITCSFRLLLEFLSIESGKLHFFFQIHYRRINLPFTNSFPHSIFI